MGSHMNTQTIVFIVVILLLIGFRIYRQTTEQRWSMKALWVGPVIFLVLAALIVALDATAQPIALPAGIVGLVAGFALGMYQGNHTRLRFDKAAGAVFIRVTPVGSAIFIGVLVLRFALRYPAMSAAMQSQAAGGGLPPPTPLEAIVGSGLLALAAGLMAGLRWYIRRAYDAAPS